MSNLVCISGGFDPIHIGHVRLIKEAAKYGPVVVILNTDLWLERKKGYRFMQWADRAEVLAAMRGVHSVVSVYDDDDSVCEALRRIKPKYFANGGDRLPDNTPEVQLCKELGIEMLFNIGGVKAESSSELVRNVQR